MIKRYAFGAIKYTAVFFITLFVLWLLLVLSALIPNESIRDNMERSVYSYSDRDAFEFTKGKHLSSVADHYADSIWLNVAWNMGVGNSFTASVKTDYYDGGELGENAGLYYAVIEGTPPNTDYTRYWHGTAMFIRLFHLFTYVEGIKAIGLAVFLLLTALSVTLLVKQRHTDIAVLLVLSLAAVHIWNIRLSVEYQPAFILAFVMIPLYLLFERHGDKRLVYLSVIGGTAVAFFDFLTTETVTILLPLALVIAVRAKEKRLGSFRQNIFMLIKCGIGWVGAYIGAFLVKWTAASIITVTNAFETALGSAQVHMLGGNTASIDASMRPDNFLSGIFANLTVLFGGTWRVEYSRAVLGTAISLMVLFSLWYLMRKDEKQTAAAILLFCLGGIVPVRFLLLNNHSYIHEFFVYRALVTSIFTLLTVVWLNIGPPRKKKRGHR